MSLFDGQTLHRWNASGDKKAFQVAQGQLVAEGPGRLVYSADTGLKNMKAFTFTADVMTQPGANCSIVFSTGQPADNGKADGFEVRINNSNLPAQTCSDLAKTGSLVGLRQQFKSVVKDGEWFKLTIAANGRRIQVSVNGALVVDYAGAEATKLTGRIPAIVCHSRHTMALFKNLAMSSVGPALPTASATPQAEDPIDAQIAELQKAGFPLIDFHVHLKGGLTADEAIDQSRRKGINYGIAANCGLKFPITDDRGIEAFVKTMAGRPVFVGMQAEGREWPRLFSKEAIARFDYIFTDGMTIIDHRGRRARLWIKEEVDIPDKQAFMELLVRTIVGILNNEPIDIYVNPTYLPDCIAGEYDQLWTPERIEKVLNAAAANGVALEISNKYNLPKPAVIKLAKKKGIKFTFGTNNTDGALGRNEYALAMIKECRLTWQDMWMPKPDGQKPVQVRKK
jgi:hypothetical protein